MMTGCVNADASIVVLLKIIGRLSPSAIVFAAPPVNAAGSNEIAMLPVGAPIAPVSRLDARMQSRSVPEVVSAVTAALAPAESSVLLSTVHTLAPCADEATRVEARPARTNEDSTLRRSARVVVGTFSPRAK